MDFWEAVKQNYSLLTIRAGFAYRYMMSIYLVSIRVAVSIVDRYRYSIYRYSSILDTYRHLIRISTQYIDTYREVLNNTPRYILPCIVQQRRFVIEYLFFRSLCCILVFTIAIYYKQLLYFSCSSSIISILLHTLLYRKRINVVIPFTPAHSFRKLIKLSFTKGFTQSIYLHYIKKSATIMRTLLKVVDLYLGVLQFSGLGQKARDVNCSCKIY